MFFIVKGVVAVILLLPVAGLCGWLFTQWQADRIAALYPNIGQLTHVEGLAINSFHWPRPEQADLPPLVFVHGASGNLRDPMGAFFEPLRHRAEMLFIDRPGHGYSERGDDSNLTPDGQADVIAALMEARKIDRAVIVGHSFGGATIAALALRHSNLAAGLLFLAPATHPWEGGVDWYYNLANIPILGRLFSHTLALPAGINRIDAGIEHVFAPNLVPERYRETAGIPLVLRPDNFQNNARDVANLLDYVKKAQPRYREISAPAIIITGDSDGIVYEELHSRGLKRDIPGAELYWIRNLGHKPDYLATDLAIAAIEKLSGLPTDLAAVAKTVEKRLAPK